MELPITLPVANLAGTRSNRKWATPITDPLNASTIWSHTNRYGIPQLQPTQFIPSELAAWNSPHERANASETGGAVHFFLDDYRFETVWRKPEATFPRIAEVGAALTPDFSVWADMPPVMQAWQIYRARWVGVLWQHWGATVIPTATWSDEDSYEVCFQGLPESSVLAVSTVGVDQPGPRPKQLPHRWTIFQAGLAALCDAKKPSALLCYGRLPFDPGVPVHRFPTFWEKRKGASDGWTPGEEEVGG